MNQDYTLFNREGVYRVFRYTSYKYLIKAMIRKLREKLTTNI